MRLFVFLLAFSSSSLSLADIFHYNNIIPGSRAMGIGGAYTALSEDASGVAYNPAGLAYTNHNEISGSANLFYSRTVEYKKAIDDASFTEEASGGYSLFFGGLYNLKDLLPGFAAGYGIYTTDSVVKNQNDFIENKRFAGNSTIERYHRSVHETASTTVSAGGVAKKIGPVAVGLAVGYLAINELNQTSQDSIIITDASPSERQVSLESSREELNVSGIEPILGFKFKTGAINIGLTYRKAFLASQQYRKDLEKYLMITDGNFQQVKDNGIDGGELRRQVNGTTSENPIGNWPAETRFGFAFAPKNMTVAMDISHRTAANGNIDSYDREAVTNYHLGFEYQVTSSIPLRLGYFTNNDARPEIDTSKQNQADHIDYQGFTFFSSYMTEQSQFSFGVLYQTGSGKAQKISGVSDVQDVEASAISYGLAITHTLQGDENDCKPEEGKTKHKKSKKS